jgi:hypothetical protein
MAIELVPDALKNKEGNNLPKRFLNKNKMKTLIDIDNWNRKEHFQFFLKI